MSEPSAPLPADGAERWLFAQADAALLLIDAHSGLVLHSNPALARWLGQGLPDGPVWAWPVWGVAVPGSDIAPDQRLRACLSLAALGLPLQGLALTAHPPGRPALALRLWLKPLAARHHRQLLCTLVCDGEGPAVLPDSAATLDALATLTTLLERHDPASVGHQRRVADLAGALARRLQWPAAEVQSVVLAALLHDLGMLSVPSQVLGQRDWLQSPQVQQIQQHVAEGVQMLAHLDFQGSVLPLIEQHHERLDGSGYPAGLSGAALLRGAQLIGMADMLDAMTRERPYQAAQSLAEALQTLRESAGVLFEAPWVQACLDLFEQDAYRFPEG